MLKLVDGKEEEEKVEEKKEEQPPEAINAIHQFMKKSKEAMEIPSEDIEGFVLLMQSYKGYIVIGDKHNRDYLVSQLDRAKLSLHFDYLTGDGE